MLADLRVRTRTIADLKMSSRSSKISSILGSYLGRCMRDADFAPLELGPVDFVTTWGSRCGVVVVAAKGAQKDSCGFFESMFRGVFGGSSQSLDGMLLLRKKVMSLFLQKWGDENSSDFRTCAWGQPELRRYVQARTKFKLEELVKDWLGETSVALRVQTFMLEVFATTFSVQIGVVTLNHDGEPILFVYGPMCRARIYLAWNGHDDHRQRFYYLRRREFVIY